MKKFVQKPGSNSQRRLEGNLKREGEKVEQKKTSFSKMNKCIQKPGSTNQRRLERYLTRRGEGEKFNPTSALLLMKFCFGLIPHKYRDVVHKTIPSANENGFHNFLDDEKEGDKFLAIFERMVDRLPNAVDYCNSQSIEILSSGVSNQLVLTTSEIAQLELCMFFNLIPNSVDCFLPSVEFWPMFVHQEKLKFIFNYFDKVLNQSLQKNSRKVVYTRVSPESKVDWQGSKRPLLLPNQVKVDPQLLIEDGHNRGLLQVDFANKDVGGSVLTDGMVAEEIMLLCSPELIVTRLFCETLRTREVLKVEGFTRFSSYSGYGRSGPKALRFEGNYCDLSKCFEDSRPRETYMVVMDAKRYNHYEENFVKANVKRDLEKAHAGFLSLSKTNVGHLPNSETDRKQPTKVITGNWGCGAFRGDKELKFVLQFLAASQCGMKMEYCTWGEHALNLAIANFLKTNYVRDKTVGEMFSDLGNFLIDYKKNGGSCLSWFTKIPV